MSPSPDRLTVYLDDELPVQGDDLSEGENNSSIPETVDIAEFLRFVAAGYFSGANDTFQLGMADAG